MNVLNCHPDISCLREPFNPDISGMRFLERVVSLRAADETLADIWSTYDGIKHVWDETGGPFGSDISYNLQLLAQPGVRVLVLNRRNQLQRLVSLELAKQTQTWHRTPAIGPDQPRALSSMNRGLSLLKQLHRWSSAKSLHSVLSERRQTTKQVDPLDPDSIRIALQATRDAVARCRQFLHDHGTFAQELWYEDLFHPSLSIEQRLDRVYDILGFLRRTPRLTGDGLLTARRLLDPSESKLNGPETYLTIPNIRQLDELYRSDEAGALFEPTAVLPPPSASDHAAPMT